MSKLPQSTNEWPINWRLWLCNSIKKEMAQGSTFEESYKIAEESCRLEFAFRRVEEASRGQFSRPNQLSAIR